MKDVFEVSVKNLDELRTIKKARAEKILNQIEARQSTNKRAIETRKKIILGALVGELLRTGKIDQATIDQGLDCYLTRKQDRDLFGLKVSEKGEGKH